MFLLFSISAGVIQIISFTLLSLFVFKDSENLFGWSHLIALLLSVIWNFTFNRKFTFCSAANVPVAMLKVALFYVVFAPLSAWAMKVLTGEGFMWNEYLVLLLTMLTNFVTEYLYQRFIVFGKSIDTKQEKHTM